MTIADGRSADSSPVASPTYPFSFPLCDLLICEFDQPLSVSRQTLCSEIVTKTNLYKSFPKTGIELVPSGPGPRSARTAADRIATIAYAVEYIYQRVIRRRAVPFQPRPENPAYLLAYVEEELECGHTVTVHPQTGDTLTARKRACHECEGELRNVVTGKKPNAAIRRSMERIKAKQAGHGWWALLWATGCAAVVLVAILYATQPEDFYRVLDRKSDFNQTIQQVHRGKALAPAVMFFCEPLPTEAGHTLISFKFTYHPEKLCYSVEAFSLLRDSATCPVVPRNCWHTDCANSLSDHVLCQGKPQFN